MQFGSLLPKQNHPGLALKEFETVLANASGQPGRFRVRRMLPKLSGQK
jgi:hypothetical protein